MKNAFRETPYFSAWGWCIDRNTFSNYVLDLSSIKIAKELRDSKIWNMLDAREREIWIRRFDRVLKDPFYTWDLQMQFSSFINDFTNFAPLYRFTDNEGFNDERATHTKEPKPKWMNNKSKNEQYIDRIAGKLINKLFNTIDQLTIIGDSKLLPVYKKIRTQIKFGKD